MENLIQGDRLSRLAETGWTMVLTYAPRVVLALITLLVGLWLINRFIHVLDVKLQQKDPTLNKFLCGLLSVLLKVLLLISVASMIGIATTSFVAMLGAAGLAVGLALQGSLSNLAGGVLILVFKPFRVGDVIEAQGFLGTVSEIQILYTIVNTFDNRRAVIPNGHLSNNSVVNYSAYGTRRIEMTFGIGYGDDIQKAKALIRKLLDEDERVLQDPEPLVVVSALGESSVNFTVRVWGKSADIWPIFWSMQEKVKESFDAEGISIPFPQRDVHLHPVKGLD